MKTTNPNNKITRHLHDTLAVFQGEVGIIPSKDFTQIITSTPTHCTVVCVSHPKRQVNVLAHIDEYTSILSTINKIEELLRREFNLSFNGPEFITTIMGGSSRSTSIEQNKELRKLLSNRQISIQNKELGTEGSKRPQILLDSSGQIQILREKQKNLALEFEQILEYGAFNDRLDQQYPGIAGHQIPYFETKEAHRHALECPTLTSLQPQGERNAGSKPQWRKKAESLVRSGHLSLHTRRSPDRIAVRLPSLSSEGITHNEISVSTVIMSLVGATLIIWVCLLIKRQLHHQNDEAKKSPLTPSKRN